MQWNQEDRWERIPLGWFGIASTDTQKKQGVPSSSGSWPQAGHMGVTILPALWRLEHVHTAAACMDLKIPCSYGVSTFDRDN